VEPTSIGYRQPTFSSAIQQATSASIVPGFSAQPADEFCRSGQEPRFGHGNPGKHPDKLKEAYRREYRRNREKLCTVSMEQFVKQKMEATQEHKKGNALRK
jgi:hypothetical protein